MKLFHVIDDAACILRSRGVFRQVAVYRRDRDIYAQHGSGFVKLMHNGGTSAPNVSWVDLPFAHPHIRFEDDGKFKRPIAVD
jgi:hypothetical protein